MTSGDILDQKLVVAQELYEHYGGLEATMEHVVIVQALWEYMVVLRRAIHERDNACEICGSFGFACSC